MTSAPYLKRCLEKRQIKTEKWAQGNDIEWPRDAIPHKEDDIAVWADMGIREKTFYAQNT